MAGAWSFAGSVCPAEPAFSVLASEPASAARSGLLRTRHGAVETPVFMPVGTQATVKALTPAQVRACGTQILLGNTYHLNLRPGPGRIASLGGLHIFMGWEGPILTDSGGFQVFSLAKLRRITDEGIHFQSHLDGARFFLGPAECIDIQRQLGSDIAMVLDECPPWPCERDAVARACERTVRWAGACRDAAGQSGFTAAGHHTFGIVQGSGHPDLRRECAEALVELDFPGYAVGGVSVGEPEAQMYAQVEATVPFLPAQRPRYVMGAGTPPQMLRMIGMGVDMFDCVLPTRLARHGSAFTADGILNLRNARFQDDPRPLVEGMDNETCRQFSRAYLRHLIQAGEILGCTLLSLHNVHFYVSLLEAARAHIAAGTFSSWSRDWIARYEDGEVVASESAPSV
jgi:queuine tRNA-ribosyltransferase